METLGSGEEVTRERRKLITRSKREVYELLKEIKIYDGWQSCGLLFLVLDMLICEQLSGGSQSGWRAFESYMG